MRCGIVEVYTIRVVVRETDMESNHFSIDFNGLPATMAQYVKRKHSSRA